PARFRRANPGHSLHCEIFRRDDSPLGLAAEDFVARRLQRANINLLRLRLAAEGITEPPVPVSIEVKFISATPGKKTSVLSSLVPLILVLMTITGAVYPAIDLTAGERERGTLEILMAAPVPRIGLLLAKYVAVLAVAMLTGLVNLTMMTVTLLASGLGQVVFEGGLTVGTVAAMLGLLLLFAMFFSAMLLAVTSFARSFKEAQAYLIPLILLALAPGMLSLMDLPLGGLLTVTPLVNVVLLARDIFKGGVNATEVVVVVGTTLGYAALAVAVAARIFGAEAVLYSDQGQWSDLFRRPRVERPAPTIAGALLCLALVFPLSVLVGGGLSQLAVPQWAHLLIAMMLSAAMFVGVPAVAAWTGRVSLVSAFRLRRAPLLAFAAAVVLGLSLWPLVAQLLVWQEQAGFSTMPQALRDRLHDLVAQRRESWPVLVLLALAVVPAVVEELFFRGWLFTALERAMSPWKVVLLTAALFGLFHLFTGGVVLVERLLPTALLGAVLGVLRWRSGSTLPGVIMHLLHNGLLVSMSLFPESFGPLAQAVEGTGTVPVMWLAAGLGGTTAGVIALYLVRRQKSEPV
ncbi:MAG: type II CAAX prenyl endopeptidase Rce1 family protein, partial [Gemmataceae bacterium]